MNATQRWRLAWGAAVVLALSIPLTGQSTQRSQAILLQPGAVNASDSGTAIWLANHSLTATWDTSSGLRLASLYDRLGGRAVPRTSEVFVLILADGRSLPGSAMTLIEPARAGDVAPIPASSRAAERVAGKELVARLVGSNPPVRVTWRAVLREGTDYVRQELSIELDRGELSVKEVALVDLQAKDARVLGTRPGAPAAVGGTFVAVEQPASRCEAGDGRARCFAAGGPPARPGRPLVCSSVIGLTRPADLQDGFVRYAELESADVFLPFLRESGWISGSTFPGAGRIPEARTSSRLLMRVIGGPYLQNPGRNEMTVMWVTERDAAGWIEFGPDGSFDTKVFPVADGLLAAGTTIHRVRLTGLKPDTVYSYRVVSREIVDFGPYKVDYGAKVVGQPARFRTPAAAAGRFSFVVLNDLHEGVALMESHLVRAAPGAPDLVFFNGDSLSHLESGDQIVGKLLEPAGRLLAGRTPFVLVRGNHETRGRFARHLDDYLALPSGRFYFSFDHGPVHFVVMDTGEDKTDDHWAYSGLTDFDGYRAAQAAWLEQEVRSAAFRNARFRVLVAHMPFFGNAVTRAEGHGQTDCRERWGRVLNEAGLDLHIAGHTHRTDWVEPAAGANRFPIVVGGGSARGTNTMIRVGVSADRLDIAVTRDDGTPAGSYVVKARGQ